MPDVESVVTYALTTKERIKEILEIDNANKDTLIERYISAVTDWIESQCQRRFLRQAISGEIYNVTACQDFLLLKQTPVISIQAFQYRNGLPNNISWVDVSAAEYELNADPEAGMINCYFQLQRGPNQYKVSYTAGYLIDFANAGNASLHTLPADLSSLAERLVIKAWKRREKPGIDSESFDANQVTYSKEMAPEDQAVIDRYKRILIL